MNGLIERIDEKNVKYLGEIYSLHGKYFRKRNEYLHRRIYQDCFGNIPVGCVVHHKDEDTKNNSPDNLELLRVDLHLSKHHKGKKLTAAHKSKITGRPKKKIDPYSNLPFPPSF